MRPKGSLGGAGAPWVARADGSPRVGAVISRVGARWVVVGVSVLVVGSMLGAVFLGSTWF